MTPTKPVEPGFYCNMQEAEKWNRLPYRFRKLIKKCERADLWNKNFTDIPPKLFGKNISKKRLNAIFDWIAKFCEEQIYKFILSHEVKLLIEMHVENLNKIEHLRARVKELEDRPIEIDISKDKIIRILTKKLEELTAENERLKNK